MSVGLPKTDGVHIPSGVQVIRSEEDLDHIRFDDDVAALEIRASLLDKVRFKNHRRGRSARLDAVVRSIRDKGYRPTEPIIARLGRKGRWVIVDGGHRITALRRLAGGLLARMAPWAFRRDYGYVYVLLFRGRRSARA